MRLTRSASNRVLSCAGLLGLLAACIAVPAHAQQPAPAPAAAAQQPAAQPSGPSGKVPPGVRLESQMPAAGAPRPFDFPRPATKLLPNGLEMFVVSRTRQPAVSITLLIPSAGTFFDPPGKTGLASLAAAVIPEGTTHRSAQEIAEAIDFVGGSLNTGAEGDGANVTITVVKKDFLLAMDLLSDVVMHPVFQPDEVERKRRQTLSNLEVESADPGYLAQVVAARVLYGMHPYGLPEDGTADSVRAITPDDLREFQRARYVPQGSFLSIAGDVTPDEAFAAAEKFLGAWGGVAPAFTAPAIPEAPAGLRFVLVDKPDAVQTQIRASRAAIPRNNPDYLSLFVANRVFGGGENSRLNASIRQKKGLTYGAYSQLSGRARAGSLSAGLSTRTETTLEALRMLLDLMGQMGTGDVTPEELRFAKDYLSGAFPMQSETPEQVAGRILSLSLYGLPADYYQRYRENLQAVTAAQVKALAAQYFGASKLSIVMVGNVGAFREALKKAYPDAHVEELAATGLDLLAPDLRRKLTSPSPDAGVPAATPEALEEGRALLAAAAKTAGGAALAGIKTVDVAAQGKLYQQAGDADVELHLQVSYPDHMRLEMRLPQATLTQGFDGTVGWLLFPGGPGGRSVSEVPPDAVSEFRRSVLLTGGVGIVNAAQAGKLELQYLGEEEVEGKQTRAVLWRGPSGPVRLYVDVGSHFLVAARFISGSPQGPAETLQMWDDYRGVEGVQFPFHTVTYQNGVRHSEIFVQQVRINQPMEPSLFVKPGF
jgi:zinc protease